MLDAATLALWQASARHGHPPAPRLVAEMEYGLTIAWWHDEAFLDIPTRLNPAAHIKSLIAREAARGEGKSTLTSFLRLYLCEWVLPYMHRPGIPIRPENRNYLVFGRDERHLRDEILGPLKNLILTCSPWLRTPNWQGIIEDTDDPSPEGLRELAEMKSKGAQKWEALRIDLANGVSIRGRTMRQSARGFHVFAADMDDPLTEQNASESADIMSLIQGSILPALEPGGIFVLCGTPQIPGDLFDLTKSSPSWDYRAYPAYDMDGTLGYAAKNRAAPGPPLSDLDAGCLWPARLPFAALEAARGRTREEEIKYQREYLLQRVTDDTALVREDDWLAARDPALSYEFSPSPGIRYYAGCDPSGRKQDDAGFCIGHVASDGTRIITRLIKLEAAPHLRDGEGEMSVIDELNALSKVYSCFDWTVEGNGFQSVILALARRLNQSIRMDKFNLGANKHSENGWLGLRTLFRSRKVRLPYKTAEDRRITDDLIHQLRGLQYLGGKIVEDPRRKNDLVSALFLFTKASDRHAPSYHMTALTSQTTDTTAPTLPGSSPRPPLFKPRGATGELRPANQSPKPFDFQDTMRRLDKWQRPVRNRRIL